MALQRHFNGTSITLQQQFNSRKKEKEEEKNGIGVSIHIGRDSQCLLYAVFFKDYLKKKYLKLILEPNVPSWKYTAAYDHLQRGADCKAQ